MKVHTKYYIIVWSSVKCGFYPSVRSSVRPSVCSSINHAHVKIFGKGSFSEAEVNFKWNFTQCIIIILLFQKFCQFVCPVVRLFVRPSVHLPTEASVFHGHISFFIKKKCCLWIVKSVDLIANRYCLLINWFVGQSDGWIVRWLVPWFVGQLVCWVVLVD